MTTQAASMRPQHITAENARAEARAAAQSGGFNEAAAYHCGKRAIGATPQCDPSCFNEAAAYHCGKRGAIGRNSKVRPASMRPQHITAENRAPRHGPGPERLASMRPQHITAENAASIPFVTSRSAGFNEAAAYHCGKPICWR